MQKFSLEITARRVILHQIYLKITSNVRRLVENLMAKREWSMAGQGWEGIVSEIQLSGWSIKRRVIVLRKEIKKELLTVVKNPISGQTTIITFRGETDDTWRTAICSYQ